MQKLLPGILILLLAIKSEGVQELSTFVYPSEDELEEAFYRGEIDFNQLVILQELIRFGIDSTQLYLLDEIPNLSFFFRTPSEEVSELSIEQERPFLIGPLRGTVPGGKISYNYSRGLEEGGKYRYRTSGEISASEDIKVAFRLHREYGGLERVVYRSIEYRPKKSSIKRLVVGNYTTRLGMGTILGYRGKLVDFSDEVDGESVLFPDYGGYNGLNMKLGGRRTLGEIAISQNRDDGHALTTTGGSFAATYKHFESMLIVSITNLRNRITDVFINDFKYGFNLQSIYLNGFNRFEISAQAGERNGFGAFVTEGRHMFRNAEIRYAGWVYDDDYLDLSAGSKAASISLTSNIEEVEFSFNDKRSGQEGALLKSVVELTDKTDMVNSIIYAQRSEENYNFEILTAVESKINQCVLLRADHVSRIKERFTTTQDYEDAFRRTRIELRYISAQFYVRTYVAYQSKTNNDDYTSFFANARLKNPRFGELSVWLNLGEFDHNQGSLDYWYGFVENKNNLSAHFRTIAKLTHSYRRGETDRHNSTVTLGVEIAI